MSEAWGRVKTQTNCTYVSGARYNHQVPKNAVQARVPSREECCRRCYENSECVVSAWHDTQPPVHNCYLHYTSKDMGHNQDGVVGCVTSRPDAK